MSLIYHANMEIVYWAVRSGEEGMEKEGKSLL